MPRQTLERFRGWLTGPAHFGPESRTVLGFIATLLVAWLLLRIPWSVHWSAGGEPTTVIRWIWDSPQRGERRVLDEMIVSTVDLGAFLQRAIIAAALFGLAWLVLRAAVQSVRRCSGQCWRCGHHVDAADAEACPACGEPIERPGRAPIVDEERRYCGVCGYDMRGSVNDRCPECGMKMVR